MLGGIKSAVKKMGSDFFFYVVMRSAPDRISQRAHLNSTCSYFLISYYLYVMISNFCVHTLAQRQNEDGEIARPPSYYFNAAYSAHRILGREIGAERADGKS